MTYVLRGPTGKFQSVTSLSDVIGIRHIYYRGGVYALIGTVANQNLCAFPNRDPRVFRT